MNLFTQHVTRLADFAGRENRQPFWLWVLIVYGLQFALTMIVSVPLTMRMTGAMQPLMTQNQDYLNAHPEIASRLMMQTMGPLMRDLLILIAVGGLLLVVLVAAAVVRRLHDGDRSGWWAAPAVAIQIALVSLYLTILPRFFALLASLGGNPPLYQLNGEFAALMPSFAAIAVLSVLGFIAGVGLIVLLALRGTTGPNRYGPDQLPPPAPFDGQPWVEPVRTDRPARVVRPWDDRPPQG